MPLPPPPIRAAAPARFRVSPAFLVLAAGIAAALHVGKLPPAIPALQAALGLSLVQAGFVLSLVQLAGMTLGAVFGLIADGLGARRSVLLGLGVLGAASAAGGWATSATPLTALRALEGFGLLLVIVPAPGLLRRLVAPGRVAGVMGLWGAYMPTATALALLAGPPVIAAWGWRSWWWALAAISLAAAAAVRLGVPADDPAPPAHGWARRLRRLVSAPGPWLAALSFAFYAAQWLIVIGFLPAIYTAQGVAGTAVGALTALVAAVNVIGNLAAGRALQAGKPPARLLAIGFATMAATAFVAFTGWPLPAALRYAAVLAFSTVGGLVPATLFALAVRTAPGDDLIATALGWVQQWSCVGQFAGPPAAAWVAHAAGGWQRTWWVTGGCAAVGLLLAFAISRLGSLKSISRR